MAPIDIVEARGRGRATEEAVIVAEGQIRPREDSLRTLIMNPTQPDFWTTRLEPSDQPTVAAQPIDVDAAIATRSPTASTSRSRASRSSRPTSA